MRILVVSQYYYPEQFRINDICEELVKRGHRVTVLTGQPNYPDGEIFDGYGSDRLEDYHNGVRILRCNLQPRHKGKVNLLKNYISFVKEATKRSKSLTNEYDLIYVYQLSPVTSAIPAIKLKRKFQIPIFLYCCDIWPDSVRDTDGEPLGLCNPIYLVAKLISRKVYSRVDRIGVKCNQFIRYLHEVCGVEEDNCVLIYEHAEGSYLSVPEEPEANGCFDFVFLGNIGLAQHCDYIVKAAEKIKTNRDFKLHFVGSGSGLETLQKYVYQNGLDEFVIFHGRHPVSEINKFYKFADCCMLTLSAKTATGLTPPAKLAGYMAASRSTIAAAIGATEDIIKESNCGICVGPEDIDGIVRAMEYAIYHQDEFIEKGKNGRTYFNQHFSLEKHIDFLEDEFRKIVGGK